MRSLVRISAATLILSAIMAGQRTAPAQERKVALIIGNDRYLYVTGLKTAVNDARAMQAILHDRYGFETTLLTDASRAQIMATLSSYRRALGPDSSLLIYYAGHGYKDTAADKSYWWPIGARTEDNSEWISADDITTSIKAMSVRHILIVSDSCFSGTLSRGATSVGNFTPGTDRASTLMKLRQRPSRELLASGGDEPVADGGAGDHSIFAGAFLRALQSIGPSEFAVEEIFQEVRESVGGTSAQLPELDPVRNSGHDGGSFVFSRADSVAAPAPGPVSVSLSSAFNTTGIETDGRTFTSGLDGAAWAYSAKLLGTTQTFNGTMFRLGPVGSANVVSGAGQAITLPAGRYSTLRMLATGVFGNQVAQTFMVTYRDGTTSVFTPSMSDWFSPQNFPGESPAVNMAYRNVSNGTSDNRPFHLYGYSFALDNRRTTASVVLPYNPNVKVLALTVVP